MIPEAPFVCIVNSEYAIGTCIAYLTKEFGNHHFLYIFVSILRTYQASNVNN